MIEHKLVPLGIRPNQSFVTPENWEKENADLEKLLREEKPKKLIKELQFIPITYAESVIPGGELPDSLLKLFNVGSMRLFLLRHPKLRDEVVLGLGREMENPTPEATRFYFWVRREIGESDSTNASINNIAIEIGGIAYDSTQRPRLLSLSYETWTDKKLKLNTIFMSLTEDESWFFSPADNNCVFTGKPVAVFTSEMSKIIDANKWIKFDRKSSQSKDFFHPKNFGTFLETKGNKVSFGLKFLRKETPTLRVPFSLKKPKGIFIPLSR
jgi:hypothetical protein